MNQPLISIVVPVYNVVEYVRTCINSLLGQTYENCEIILVDDGSTDGCESICDHYADLYPAVHVIHQEKQGLSSARNAGVSAARGDYIAFVDSDDYVSPVFIEALYISIKDSGFSMATVRRGTKFYDGDEPNLEESLQQASLYEILTEVAYQRELLYQVSGNGAPWRLCEKSLLELHSFPEGLVYEDFATTYKLVKECGSVAVLKSVNLYAYRLRRTSIMHGQHKPIEVASCLAVTRQVYGDICSWYPSLASAAASRCFAVCRVTFAKIPDSEASSKAIIWEELKRYKSTVLRDGSARKRERIAALAASTGESAFALFCMLYRKVLQ